MGQERINSSDNIPRKPSDTYRTQDIDETLARSNRSLNKVRVVHGANEQYFDSLEGKTVGQVRKSLRDAFNIPGDADALIQGKEVGDDFVLEGGMSLEFTKEAGVKGGR